MRDRLYDNLVGIQREMLKILSEVSSITSNPLALEDPIDNAWHPKCDIYQTDTQWIVIVELAGVCKEDINISITSEYLRISGVRRLEMGDPPTCYFNMEIETGNFDRRIFFPDISLDKDDPRVFYQNGILRIVFDMKPVVERLIPID